MIYFFYFIYKKCYFLQLCQLQTLHTITMPNKVLKIRSQLYSPVITDQTIQHFALQIFEV